MPSAVAFAEDKPSTELVEDKPLTVEPAVNKLPAV